MSKLWEKGYKLDSTVEKFCTGNDPILDQQLIYYDCIGSIAHTTMLEKIGILSKKELKQIKSCLIKIIKQNEKNQ
jgi:argininosuccinate lyase